MCGVGRSQWRARRGGCPGRPSSPRRGRQCAPRGGRTRTPYGVRSRTAIIPDIPRTAAASTAMAAPLTLGVLLLLHLVSPIAGAGSTTAHHANVAIENEVAVVRVEEIAPMMLMTSTQTAYLRPWTTTRGSGGRSLKWTLKNSDSDLSYISQYTSKWVTDSLNYDDASSDPAVRGPSPSCSPYARPARRSSKTTCSTRWKVLTASL